jgi:hypothetical protein
MEKVKRGSEEDAEIQLHQILKKIKKIVSEES